MANKTTTSITKFDLPTDFLTDFESYFGKDFLHKYQTSYNEDCVRGLRVNPTKIDVDEFKNCFEYNIESIPYFSTGYYLNTNKKLGNSALHHAGAFYLQEPSSMIPVASVKNLDFNNKIILDLCASPGGKSTQIASLMKGGVLISNEIDPSRASKLFSNIERLGLNNVIVTNESPLKLSTSLKEKCDYIFVDAPCSGEGMFRKDEVAVKMWNSNLKLIRSNLQLEILEYANKMLKPNGILIYSTCTFNLVENEYVVDKFSKTFNYTILPVHEDVLPFTVNGQTVNNNNDLLKTKHFFPFIAKGEGQFVAVMQKNNLKVSNIVKNNSTLNLNSKENLIVKKFLSNILHEDIANNLKFEKINNLIHILPNQDINLTNCKILCKGVILGEIKNDILFPHHQFFSSYGKYFKTKFNLNLDNNLIKKYISGEQISLNQVIENCINYIVSNSKYGVIMVNGASLGGVKIVNNDLKNHYPKGLRANIVD